MKTQMTVQVGFVFLLLLIQVYVFFCISLMLLRKLRLLKRPYSGMDYPEALFAGVVILGVLFISTATIPGLFQAAGTYTTLYNYTSRPLLLFFARSLLTALFFGLLFIGLNLLNLRLLLRNHNHNPGWVISIMLSTLAIGIALICWFACKELIDDMAPKVMNF